MIAGFAGVTALIGSVNSPAFDAAHKTVHFVHGLVGHAGIIEVKISQQIRGLGFDRNAALVGGIGP